MHLSSPLRALGGLCLAARALGLPHELPESRSLDLERRGQYGGEVPMIRSYFYAGGHYADDGTGSHIYKEQMYVERLEPANGATKGCPIVFIHGQAQTGTNFLNKPDGGRGWASQFIEQGYEIYIVDQTVRARSAWQPNASGPVKTYSAEIIEQRFTAPQNFNLWQQAKLHTQWPGPGTMGDKVFDNFYSSNIQFIDNATYQQSTMQTAGAALMDHIGKPVVLMGHSQGGIMPWLLGDARPHLTKAIIALEPSGPPFQEAIFSTTAARAYGLTDIPIAYDPPLQSAKDLVTQTKPASSKNSTACTLQKTGGSSAPRKLKNLAKLPILMVTTEASYHAAYDWCTFDYLKQAGCSKAEHLVLPDVGIHGNGHMMFLEKNSDVIQGKIKSWIEKLA